MSTEKSIKRLSNGRHWIRNSVSTRRKRLRFCLKPLTSSECWIEYSYPIHSDKVVMRCAAPLLFTLTLTSTLLLEAEFSPKIVTDYRKEQGTENAFAKQLLKSTTLLSLKDNMAWEFTNRKEGKADCWYNLEASEYAQGPEEFHLYARIILRTSYLVKYITSSFWSINLRNATFVNPTRTGFFSFHTLYFSISLFALARHIVRIEIIIPIEICY